MNQSGHPQSAFAGRIRPRARTLTAVAKLGERNDGGVTMA
jgi:hypothetical protein